MRFVYCSNSFCGTRSHPFLFPLQVWLHVNYITLHYISLHSKAFVTQIVWWPVEDLCWIELNCVHPLKRTNSRRLVYVILDSWSPDNVTGTKMVPGNILFPKCCQNSLVFIIEIAEFTHSHEHEFEAALKLSVLNMFASDSWASVRQKVLWSQWILAG